MTDIELYNRAKDAYYNGSPIMEDFEFDELEERLGLTNKSYVGARHNPSYTIQHPFIMGSLSKVQIKKGKDSGIDWTGYLNQLNRYVGGNECIITPKYDGCSFEVVATSGKVRTISSRGDGEFGKDLFRHLIGKVREDVGEICWQMGERTVRLAGEVLIDKDVFNAKYKNYVNPRSFVSGLLNRDYDETDNEFIEMLSDLSVVIYDIRGRKDDAWVDYDWSDFTYASRPQEYVINRKMSSASELKEIYESFEHYRNDICPYALDGIVFKPMASNRINNTTEVRPKDCVAIKFLPQLQETEVTDIVWEQGKTGELFPVIIVNPVIMDGKTVTRASAHNWGYLIEKGINIGAKVVLSLAGDIIPFIYKVTQPSSNLEVLGTVDYDRTELEIHGCHLYKMMTPEEKKRLSFISSGESLEIPGIGPSALNTIWEYVSSRGTDTDMDDFFGTANELETPFNILLLNSVDIETALGGKLGKNAKKEYDKVLANIALEDIIKSCSFRFCGDRMSAQVANYMLDMPYDWTSMASEGYSWVFDIESEEYCKVMYIIDHLHKTLDDFKIPADTTVTSSCDQTPVILTGEPTGYKTKAEFLQCHPEYRNTTSWKEVKIVFTNSLDSNTGKMKKAREKGIEIRLY